MSSFIMLRLMVAYEGLIEMLHHVFLNELGFEVYVFVGNLGEEFRGGQH